MKSLFLSVVAISLVPSALVYGAALNTHLGKRTDAKAGHSQDEAACLATDARQTASGLTGQEGGAKGIKSGQSPSAM